MRSPQLTSTGTAIISVSDTRCSSDTVIVDGPRMPHAFGPAARTYSIDGATGRGGATLAAALRLCTALWSGMAAWRGRRGHVSNTRLGVIR